MLKSSPDIRMTLAKSTEQTVNDYLAKKIIDIASNGYIYSKVKTFYKTQSEKSQTQPNNLHNEI